MSLWQTCRRCRRCHPLSPKYVIRRPLINRIYRNCASSSSSTSFFRRTGARSTTLSQLQRVSRKLLCFTITLGTFYFFMDADFVTYFYDLYRSHSSSNANSMANKTVWIIGASSGIGEYLVYELVQSGVKQIIISSRRRDQLQRVYQQCQQLMSASSSADCNIVIAPLDMMQFVQNAQFADNYVDKLMNDLNAAFVPESDTGGLHVEPADIDIVVINAGRTQKSYALDNEQSILLHLQQLNVFAPIAVAQAMCKYWRHTINADKVSKKEKKLHQIAITSSVAGLVAAPKSSAYSMTKAAIQRYMETLRMECVDDKIDVNLVCPGPVELSAQSHASFGKSPNDTLRSRREGRVGVKDMTLTRCASLYATALQYSLTESWISPNPVLLFTYLRQYVPILFGPMGKIIGPKYVKAADEKVGGEEGE